MVSCREREVRPVRQRLIARLRRSSIRRRLNVVMLLESLVQSRDHPACLNAEQALYLKGFILQVL